MALRTMENGDLRVTVSDHGAELTSVWDKKRDQERIWTGDPAVWNRHAPILFPFVGKVTGGAYRLGEREYAMKTQHGFARDMDFECVQAEDSRIVHRLTATEATREIYPFDFELTVSHVLPREGRSLKVEWRVKNLGAGTMFFSIGGHPGFMPPAGKSKEDMSISFPGMASLHYVSSNPAGFALPERHDLTLTDEKIPYREDIPETWIFEDGQVKSVGLAGPDGERWVRMDCEGFPILAVWANPKGPFICLEPWFGRTDDAGFTGTMDRKKDMQAISAGEARDIAYGICFY